MRLHSSLAAMVLVCAGIGAQAQLAAPSCADLHVVPAPRECTAVASIPVGESGISISYGKDAADEFAAKDLEESLKDRGVSSSTRGSVVVRLEPATGSTGKELLSSNKLALDPAMHDEGYVIVPDGKKGLAVVAETSTGLFYGAQTVKQLLRGTGKDAVLVVPTLRDWPAMAHRALSDDWSRGPIPNMEFLKREIRTLAAYKVNIFSPYFEHTFAYASTSVAAFPGGAMTPEEGRELVEYAGKYHIMVIPEQESFGHLHHVLKFEQYSHLAETPHGAVLAPGDEGSLPQIKEWFGELDKVFPAPYSHIGADETFELGLGRTRDQVTQRGLGAVYLEFLSKIHQTLAPYNKRLLFWGDVAVNSPELVGTLPKDMIAVPWRYDAEPDFTPLIVPFTKAGLETWVAPGVNNWNRVYPNNNEALGNIRAFVRDGQKLGATGEINTVWNDDGEGIFDENWFGVVFGAAAGWQQGESSEDNFIASFAQSFHDDQTGKIGEAHRALMAAHNVLKKAGLEDGQDTLFWIDPLSPGGREVSAKLLRVASELRLDAEKAITLLAQARAAGKLDNQEALDAMELGARRLDFIGYKFQLAAACVDDYKQALALAADPSRHEEVSVLLENIQSNNGRFEDMRDGYGLLGQLFEQAWLRDNRQYWLANNVALYENATQMWVERANRFRAVVWNQWWSNHTLPPASETGLPALGN
jgi:hexosaminidase